MQKIIKLLIVAITLGMVLTSNVYAKPVDKKKTTNKIVKTTTKNKVVKTNKKSNTVVKHDVYEKKSKKYYKEFKEEWSELPPQNKKRIILSYQQGMKSGMGLTLAGTKFLESRGKLNDTVSTNNNGDYISFNCGDYGINTMTYLMSIGKKSKSLAVHKQACNKLINDKQLNLSMALKVYNYAKDRYNNDTIKVWNYYASGKDKIVGDRIYRMKAITTVIKEELSKQNITVASNKETSKKFTGTTLASIVNMNNKKYISM